MNPAPRRALIVSADIGEGHNSAARALEEAAGRVWPDCQVRRLDALAVMGTGFAQLARAFYVAQVQYLPWMYEFFFAAMWRHRWYLEATRHGTGARFGRRMAPWIRAFDPEVVISTYPLGSAGLSWLRQRGELKVPVGAWIPAFCPHPSWLYRNLDITYVMHRSAARVARRAEPGMRIAVGALPVTDAFAAGDQAAARAGLGVRADRFTVLLCTGSLAFGRVDEAVAALLAAGSDLQVIVACGRNAGLRERLCARGEPADRLRVLGWTDDMPGWMTAADVVVGNAGGATALEAVTSGRPVIMFKPIAGHGRANAALMASSGLALLAPSPVGLTAAVRHLADDPGARARQAAAGLARAQDRRREDDLAELALLRSPPA